MGRLSALQAATALLKEVLPLDKGISFSGLRQRAHAVAKELDAEVERDIANQPNAVAAVLLRESTNTASVSADSAWSTHYSHPKSRAAARAEALASAASFATGAALPLLAAAMASQLSVIAWVSVASLVFLALLGAIAARVGGASAWIGAWRVTCWGALAMAVTAGAGALFGAVA